MCAALCPKSILGMQWNRYGEYNPSEVAPCTTECSLCLGVCPFADSDENEDTLAKALYGSVPGIQHRPETGYFLASYVGYSERHRATSASGGMATWLLETLLTKGVVDHIICVVSTGDSDKLFTFRIVDTIEGVRSGAGSVYYPVEMSEVTKKVLDVPGRYAIVGLPCFIKAIRLAQQRNKKLQERIVVCVGLVCGQLKSKHFTSYIATLAGVKGILTAVHYRGKSRDQPASNFYFSFLTAEGEKKKVFWNEGVNEAWTNRWFTPTACNYCDDVFAECADVVCMDAWLPEYSQDSQGTNLVLVRSPMIQEMFERGHDVHLNSIPVERIMQSQAGVVAVKRGHLAYQLYLDLQEGLKKPRKRVLPGKPRNSFVSQNIILKNQMQRISKEKWVTSITKAENFQKNMHPYLKKIQRNEKILRISTFPHKTIKVLFGRNQHE
jgi:coenzyme F420 hydrogenase subunit beta